MFFWVLLVLLTCPLWMPIVGFLLWLVGSAVFGLFTLACELVFPFVEMVDRQFQDLNGPPHKRLSAIRFFQGITVLVVFATIILLAYFFPVAK